MAGQLREFEVILPIGVNGVQRQAALRKMRGHEEALLYDPGLNPAQLVTSLLSACLVRLGDLGAPSQAVVSGLYTADRNYLLVELRRITLGDRLEASYQCPGCGQEAIYVEDLGQMEVRRLEEGQSPADITVQLEDGYVDRDGTLHTEVVLTLPRGADEEFVAPMAEKDPLKMRDALMLRCIKKFGTVPRAELEAYGAKILRDLTMGDRLAIDRALNQESPGIDLTRRLTCPGCGRAFAANLDMTNFFFPG